jgi:hypothetical protein
VNRSCWPSNRVLQRRYEVLVSEKAVDVGLALGSLYRPVCESLLHTDDIFRPLKVKCAYKWGMKNSFLSQLNSKSQEGLEKGESDGIGRSEVVEDT